MDPNNPSPIPTPPQPNIPTPQVVANPLEPVAPLVPNEPENPITNKPARKLSRLLIVAGVIFLFILIAIGAYFYIKNKKSKSSSEYNEYEQSAYTSTTTPTDVPLIKTIAPPGTPDYALSYYRTSRATVTEAQAIDKEVGSVFGSIPIPSDIKYIHEEEYKGIPIKWTAGQPIPEGRLIWLKSAIDKLPPFFSKDHPVTGIISATPDELKIPEGVTKSQAGMASAYASGLNIYLTNNLLLDNPLYAPLEQTQMTYVLFHEWTHVVQYYEALQTFSKTYLEKPGMATVALILTPFTKDFGKSVGWEFWDDRYNTSWQADLKTDAESQKTSDYGKRGILEDMAETASFFMTCQTSKISTARISWMEKITNTKASFYCN